jgi:hypothetical protein
MLSQTIKRNQDRKDTAAAVAVRAKRLEECCPLRFAGRGSATVRSFAIRLR